MNFTEISTTINRMSLIRVSFLTFIFKCLVLESILGWSRALDAHRNITIGSNQSIVTEKEGLNITVVGCDRVDCIRNIAFCEYYHCSQITRMRTTHYVVSSVVVLAIVILMLITVYSCHKESKRLVGWGSSATSRQNQLLAIHLVQRVVDNNALSACETIPLQRITESPPPYEGHEDNMTPPPDYEEAIKYSNVL